MNSIEEIAEYIVENGNDSNVVLLKDYDYATAFIGLSNDGRAIYDYNLMVQYLLDNEHWTEEECIDWIDYNTLRAVPYMENGPIILFPIM